MTDLRVLLVEDDPLDAELVIRELNKNGYEPEWQRVDTQSAFVSRLAETPPDVIISDHAMPQFSSVEALRCLQKSGLMIPFIVVSHAIGEEEAVQLIRDGAADYLMKDRLGRIGEAVRHAMEQQRLRKEHADAQQEIVALNAELERRIAERTAQLEASNRHLEAELDQRKRAEEALHRLNDELEQRVDKRTRDVVASHHRLRALASELTLAEQRERKRLSAELHDYLAQMLALGRMKIAQLRPKLDAAPAAMPLVREIDDLFEKAMTYTRSLMAKLNPSVLDELGLPAALSWLAEQMPLHGLTVEVCLQNEQVPLPDDQAVLLFQSVRELLINVAKHADTDRATVTLRFDENNRLCIDVRDAGRGFDATALETKTSEEHFGLFTIRERMQAMGGWLAINSAVGKGTTMTLSLPLGVGAAAEVTSKLRVLSSELSEAAISLQRSALSPRSDYSDLKTQSRPPIRILLVDDHVMLRQGLIALLEGYPDVSVIGEAGDGAEGVMLAAELEPNIVLMDINMPRMDGIEATKRIKQESPETVVIALSMNNSPQIIEAMKTAGATSFVSKDAAAEQLYDAIVAATPVGISAEQTRQARLF